MYYMRQLSLLLFPYLLTAAPTPEAEQTVIADEDFVIRAGSDVSYREQCDTNGKAYVQISNSLPRPADVILWHFRGTDRSYRNESKTFTSVPAGGLSDKWEINFETRS